ncbi:MAG: hypothetical protein M3Y53_13020 [Thermoproteota archaeon]|nr:hypothetical protein [Thermoproteota archaeon]
MIVGAIILLLLCSAVLTNLAFGQIFPKTPPSKSGSNPNSTLTLQHRTKPNMVKITSPIKGQHVPVRKDLVISGTSAGNSNPTSINCQVFVIVNGIKPYQQSTPIGPNGAGDYSKWSFSLTPKYTTINEGQNKLTAKFSCANGPTSFHNSLNVTGVTVTANVTTAKS